MWSTGLESLPNELLIQILSTFSIRSLLKLATLSKRFHNLVLRMIHTQLNTTASIQNHKLILECFHPSAKWSTPGLPCEYLGIHNLPDALNGDESFYGDDKSPGRLGKLCGLYSHFKPQEAEKIRRTRMPHPAGDVPGHPNTSSAQDLFDAPQVPSQDVHLDYYERFSQLCTIANLVKIGPKPGLFLSCVTIGEGTIRVFRDWLAKNAISREEALTTNNMADLDDPGDDPDDRLIWLDRKKNVGVRLRVVILHASEGPLLQESEHDPPVSYMLEYEELLIRTTQLLLKVDESLAQEQNQTGKALIIGNWVDS